MLGLVSSAILLVLALVQSCGVGPGLSSGDSGLSLSSGSSGPDGQNDEGGDSGNPEETEKPYAAIPPPKGSKPLRDQPEIAGGGPPYNKALEGQEGLPAGRMLVRGVEDPSDGPLKDNRLVTYYGTPLSGYMGILGELPPGQMMRQLKKQTRAYSAADPERPAVPTVELIASVAQRNPGPDGLYLQPTPEKEIRRYSRLAEDFAKLLPLLGSHLNASLAF